MANWVVVSMVEMILKRKNEIKIKIKIKRQKRIAGIEATELRTEGKNRYNRILKRLNWIMVHSGMLILLLSYRMENEMKKQTFQRGKKNEAYAPTTKQS